MNLISKWRGFSDREDGFGRLEESGHEIHFDSFKDFNYISELLNTSRATGRQAGREDALSALKNYVDGIYQPANSRCRTPPPLTTGLRRG